MRREITVIVVLFVIVVALALTVKFASVAVEEGDASKFVMEDLGSKFPDADKIEIVGFEPKTNELGQTYYIIKARVSSGLASPCPMRTNYYYTYPAQNFAPAPPEYVVKECSVCTNRPCVIAFEEEAIIASHTLQGTENVHQYALYARGAKPSVSSVSAGWNVLWTSELNYSYNVTITNDGWVVGIERLEEG